MTARKANKVQNVSATTEGQQRKYANLIPFKPGQSGNPKGRAPGARNKLDELFVAELYKDFKESGVAAIQACRTEKPDVYLNVIAKVLPKQVDVKADSSVADLADGLHAVAEFLSAFAENGSGPDHEGSLPDGPLLSPGLRAQTH